MNILFLLAHQDDEFGVFSEIERRTKAGQNVVCAFVTNGGATAAPAVRNAESLKVLNRLGVKEKNILFLGDKLSIPDGQLNQHITSYAKWLFDCLKAPRLFDVIYIPALEGGHPDHDLLHAATVFVSSKRDCVASVKQYSLYNSAGCSKPFFRVLHPLKENGPVIKRKILLKDRIRYLALCLSYRSQWKTWIGLFPFVAIHYMFRGNQQLQEVAIKRVGKRPHDGPLYFEQRQFLTWEEYKQAVRKIRFCSFCS